MQNIILLLITVGSLGLATESGVTGIRSAALRESNIASENDAGAFQLNPALAADVKRVYLDGWHARLFEIKELPLSGGVLAFPIGAFAGGVAAIHLGHTLYTETRFTFNMSGNWRTGISAGLNVQYRQTDVARYGIDRVLSFDVGFAYQVSNVLRLAGVIQNLNHPQLNESGEELEPIIRMGCAYKPSEAATAFLAVMKEGAFQPEVVTGVEFAASDHFTFLSSVELNNMKPAGGFQVRVHNVFVNYALQYHFELGATHIAGISFVK